MKSQAFASDSWIGKGLTRDTNLEVFLPLGLYIAFQVPLLIHDLAAPASFMAGDRAIDRMEKINSILTNPSDPARFLNQGVPGDFLAHAALYAFGGRWAIIFVQIALMVITIAVSCILCSRLSKSRGATLFCGVMLAISLGSLGPPHTLVTEPWFCFLVTLSTFLVLASLDNLHGRKGIAFSYLSFLGFGIASSFRPQGLLIPAAVAACLLWRNVRPRHTLIGATLAYAFFPITWIILRGLIGNDFSMGASDADLSVNLYIRAYRIVHGSITLNDMEGRMSLGPFLDVLTQNPVSALRVWSLDLLNLLLNPGAATFFEHYLGFAGGTYDPAAWQKAALGGGISGVVAGLTQKDGVFQLLFLFFGCVQVLILTGFGIFLLRFARRGSQAPTWVWIVVTVTVCVLLTSLAAGLIRWSHRAGVEPLMIILASIQLVDWRSSADSD